LTRAARFSSHLLQTPATTDRLRRHFILPEHLISAALKKLHLIKSPQLTRLLAFDYHKIEAFEFVPSASGGVAFATDDENLGAAIRLDW
jgi:hypothetical protein